MARPRRQSRPRRCGSHRLPLDACDRDELHDRRRRVRGLSGEGGRDRRADAVADLGSQEARSHASGAPRRGSDRRRRAPRGGHRRAEGSGHAPARVARRPGGHIRPRARRRASRSDDDGTAPRSRAVVRRDDITGPGRAGRARSCPERDPCRFDAIDNGGPAHRNHACSRRELADDGRAGIAPVALARADVGPTPGRAAERRRLVEVCVFSVVWRQKGRTLEGQVSNASASSARRAMPSSSASRFASFATSRPRDTSLAVFRSMSVRASQ